MTARSDATYCSPACKAAARRRRRHNLEAVAIGLWFTMGIETEHVVRCPACGRRFAHKHGHRRDARYCCSACRQAAYRARKAERVREAVTVSADVTDAGTGYTPLISQNETVEMSSGGTS
ncbi:hypothetical protein [Kitasatospora sp. GP82]|uniref:hypothetical protein n=1 Tax=Kitasatospora sp. GP82 TaxID=3035089 RepID=UPI0024763CE0|nr:hypothetical protein [Kitasatospora sp. GP82]MDH6130349.1 putative SprT family Zn-dependent metalloprotease [Kitasatospora sp. GP82]